MLSQNSKYIQPLNESLRVFFKSAAATCIKDPAQALYFVRTVRNQRRAAGVRKNLAREGIQVPPIMIFSITNRCNLHCQGCYHQALRNVDKAELSTEKLRGIIAEAKELGISFIVLAGGEPLVRDDILQITKDFPEIIFLMFTNGTLISDEMISQFKSQRNIIPLLSIEGYESETDIRRGDGVYEKLRRIVKKLKGEGVFFGVSLTMTQRNFNIVTHEDFISGLTAQGCKLFLFAEYTPVKTDTEDWIITQEQREYAGRIMNDFRAKYSALFVAVPGDEKEFGGCLSAGRGFIHISAEGDVEPCPFVPYSDTNLKDKSLKEALQSGFLKAIRENVDLGKETGGSCALFSKREWVQATLARSLE